MITKRTFLVFGLLLLSGIIFYSIWLRRYPYIINHEKPNIQADFSPFANSGCKEYSELYGYFCDKNSPLSSLGCYSIVNKPLLGG